MVYLLAGGHGAVEVLPPGIWGHAGADIGPGIERLRDAPTGIPYGTELWIAELEDKDVPCDPAWGAFDHDGSVIAADNGSAITGMHVDWFVGRRENYAALDDIFGLTTVTIHAAGDRRP